MASTPTLTATLARVEAALLKANTSPSRNTYLWRDPAWTRAEAQRSGDVAGPLAGWPVSVKDCFDLAGAPTTLGLRDGQPNSSVDSWLVEQLRAAGAVIVGKTHMHPLAFGLTGENPDFGDCLVPGDAGALTGGSSSGAAASVKEGSAVAAIGSDTGGSIRVPAALCGVAGYRTSWGLGHWRGAGHLAESFDTMGWLFAHLEDGPRLASIFGVTETTALPTRFAVVHDEFLADCEPVIIENLRQCEAQLQALGLARDVVEVSWWHDSREIFAPLQAAEAAQHHRGDHPRLDPAIRQRLEWGASLTAAELDGWRARWREFRRRMDALLATHELLLLPAAPITRLAAGMDHAVTRPRLLRYTTPGSLSGMPIVTVPYLNEGQPAGGMQLMAARGDDARLLALAAALGRHQALGRMA